MIGDLESVTNALGQRTDYLEYDGNGRLLQLQDPNGVVISMTYHPRGWISSRTKDGKTTSFAYDDVGNLTRITQPDGSFIAYEYDLAHRMNAIEDNFGNRIEYTLDAAGNRVLEQTYDDGAALHRQLTRVYDQLNRLQSLIDGNNDATGYGYDNNGNRSATLDADSNTTSFEYDALDRLIRTIDANLGETDMGYDARDNLTSVADPLNDVTQYTYDGLDNQTELDSPDTGVTTYEYDDAGNRIAATDARNVRVEYAYDALNRLTGVSYPDSSLDVSFTYDTGAYGKGRLTQMVDAVGTVDYSYDARGNLTSETRTFGVDHYVTSYAYNGADRLRQITYPSGMVIDYTLDAAGRITAVDKTVDSVTEPLASNVQYEPFGPMATFTYGNGLTYSATYDQDFELDHLQAGNNLDWVFGYDPVGNILSIDDQIDNNLDQTLTYDDLYRLDTAHGGYGSEDFDYDANGNRTHYQNGIVDDAYAYAPQSNRLSTQNGWAFSRDAAGNRTEKLDGSGYGQLYAFADHNRLVQTSIRDGAGNTVVGGYQYDGRGQRTIKTTAEGTTHFIYGPSGELLGEYADSGDTLREHIYLNGQPEALYLPLTTTPTPIDLVVDNGDAGTSASGTWGSSTSVTGFAGVDYQYHLPNGAPTGGVIVDNESAGFSTTGSWPHSTSVAGYEGTDYQYHAPQGAPPGGMVIDDGSAATSTIGTWPASTYVSGYEGSHYSSHAAGVGDNTFTWHLSGVTPGDYQLYAKWTSHSNRASNAGYDVQHTGGVTTVTLDQRSQGGKWVLLGTFTLDANSEVTLSDAADGYVIADAIQAVAVGAEPNTASWASNLSAAGPYRVYARWTAHANRASDAGYTVHHRGGDSTIVVNQRQNGTEWQLLGTFDLDGSSFVTLTDRANGNVIADAVYFVADDAPANTFAWQAGVTGEGTYEVFARWTAHANRASDATYTVYHTAGSTEVTVDQQQNGGAWVSLGSYTLDNTSAITLTDQADGIMVADAIRVVGSANQLAGGTFFIHSDHLGTPRQVSDEFQTVVWRWDSTPFGDSVPDEDPDGDGIDLTLNLRFPGQYFDAESGCITTTSEPMIQQ